MTTPDTTAPKHAADEPISYELEPVAYAELEADSASFLPLAARRVLYVLGLAGVVVAPVLAISQPEYATAIVTSSGILTAAALGTALANPSR
ncbi:hypothetical protein [Agromyces sp. CCNWLW203]|uniref:hypothetical protein n=1 Tax=Agromyces sp. CCNWLW203 TaxID=3112842 RepID=UPI002F96263F